LEDLEVQKKKKEELAKDLNAKEGAIISGQVQSQIATNAAKSRDKRKAGAIEGNSTTSSLTSSKETSPSDAHSFLDDFIFSRKPLSLINIIVIILMSSLGSGSESRHRGGGRSVEDPKVLVQKRLAKLTAHFGSLEAELGEEEAMEKLAEKLRFERLGVVRDLVKIGSAVFVNDYVMCECKAHFVEQLRDYGLNSLEASKLFVHMMTMENAVAVSPSDHSQTSRTFRHRETKKMF